MNFKSKSTFALITGLAALGFSILAFAQSDTPAPAHENSHAVTAAPAEHAHEASAKVSFELALKRLKDGNLRFTSNHVEHPHQSADRRTELSKTQAPFAVIIGCSDSRTAPEVLFDQGLGDLFVVRVAGNVVDDNALGSIEYAAEHLHSGLIVVLGHERCGAVKAARETIAAGQHAPGHIDSLVTALRPAVESTTGKDAEETCKANVTNTVNNIRNCKPILDHLAQNGEVKVIGAYYDLDTGAVTFLDDSKQLASEH